MSVPGQGPRLSPIAVAVDPVVLEQAHPSSPLPDSAQVFSFLSA